MNTTKKTSIPPISDEQMVKILFYVDVAGAIILPLLGWYFENIWLVVSGGISIFFAVFKPMKHVRPWLEKHLKNVLINPKA